MTWAHPHGGPPRRQSPAHLDTHANRSGNLFIYFSIFFKWMVMVVVMRSLSATSIPIGGPKRRA